MTDNTGFVSFAMYNALKLHFTSDSYDYFKYNGKTNVTKQSFEVRRDKYHFYKLSRKYSVDELRNFYIANFVYGESTWIGNLLTSEAEDTYKKWQKIDQSLTYTFGNDIMYVLDKVDNPDELLVVNSNQFPKLLQYMMSGSITYETIIIMNSIMNFLPMWKKEIYDDIVWPNELLLIEKYTPFVTFDKSKFKTILKEKLEEYVEA